MIRRNWAVFGIVFCTFILIHALVSSCSNPQSPADSKAEALQEAKYIGGEQCRTCHPHQFDDWKKSDHFKAMSPANDSTILGNFNNATYIADGVTSKFFKRDGKYFINTQGEDGGNHDFEIKYTFGYYPLQQYLVAFPGGRMQSTRLSWDVKNKKWFHQYAGQKIHHRDWLHWTGNSQNWNTMCASCHSTDLRKNYNYSSDEYHTVWKEINVSCETCHGPGSRHISFIQSSGYKSGEKITNSGFIYSRDTISKLQINSCAPCHARKSDISGDWVNSPEIMDNLIPEIISNEYYFRDGQINQEDYEYGSFLQSKMFKHNVRCSNCHNPHSDKLRIEGNNLCLSCHKSKYDSPDHHFHEMFTEGSQCINCHMPMKTYMGIDNRRDHSFRIPRPDQSVSYGTPNACTGCHKNKSDEWASSAIIKWYGNKRKYHFSDDLAPGSLLNNESEEHLLRLLSDTAQPAIARATAAYYLGNLVSEGSARGLLSVLQDNEALVRYHAIRSLENFDRNVWMDHVYGNLSDNVRAVRIAAADLYHKLPLEKIPSSFLSAYHAADAENKNFLHYQTDFSVGNVMLGDYNLQDGDNVSAIANYLRGLTKDSLMNYARLNLSVAYSSIGKNEEALKTLKEAAAIDPENDRVYYNLGLLYYELNDTASALINFRKAVQLNSLIPGLYYNFGLALMNQKKLKEAEKIFLRGISIFPDALNLNYTLAFLYLNQNDSQKAKPYIETLYRLDPQNSEYQSMYRKFGLLN